MVIGSDQRSAPIRLFYDRFR